MIVLIDNYDSFSYNLYQYLAEAGSEVKVVRNDAFLLEDIEAWQPQGIVLSPGPKKPKDAGLLMPLIERYSGRFPILGVCLGHQAIGEVYGMTLTRAKEARHGKTSWVEHNSKDLFAGIANPTQVGRYHSLLLQPDPNNPAIEVTAHAKDDQAVMALRHKKHLTFGLQFHPESILSPDGKRMLQNFLKMLAK